MPSRHLVDPELLGGLDFLPVVDFSPAVLQSFRDLMGAMQSTREAEIVEGVEVRECRIPTPEGHEIGLVIHTPQAAAPARPAVLHMHGGGYVIGMARMSVVANQRMALDADCVVVSVDYRLAPETIHPGPVEDCYAALKWLHDNAASLGVDANRIAVTGESAGGGLAAGLALLARDRGEVRIIHQNLVYPMIDDRTGTADLHPYCGQFVWTPTSNRFGWSSLLGCASGGEGVSPYAAAARADELSGLPDTFIAVGALDLFAEEDMEFARRLIRAGVPTELHVYPGAYHGFEVSAGAAVVKDAARIRTAALRRALHANAGAC